MAAVIAGALAISKALVQASVSVENQQANANSVRLFFTIWNRYVPVAAPHTYQPEMSLFWRPDTETHVWHGSKFSEWHLGGQLAGSGITSQASDIRDLPGFASASGFQQDAHSVELYEIVMDSNGPRKRSRGSALSRCFPYGVEAVEALAAQPQDIFQLPRPRLVQGEVLCCSGDACQPIGEHWPSVYILWVDETTGQTTYEMFPTMRDRVSQPGFGFVLAFDQPLDVTAGATDHAEPNFYYLHTFEIINTCFEERTDQACPNTDFYRELDTNFQSKLETRVRQSNHLTATDAQGSSFMPIGTGIRSE